MQKNNWFYRCHIFLGPRGVRINGIIVLLEIVPAFIYDLIYDIDLQVFILYDPIWGMQIMPRIWSEVQLCAARRGDWGKLLISIIYYENMCQQGVWKCNELDHLDKLWPANSKFHKKLKHFIFGNWTRPRLEILFDWNRGPLQRRLGMIQNTIEVINRRILEKLNLVRFEKLCEIVQCCMRIWDVKSRHLEYYLKYIIQIQMFIKVNRKKK